MEPHPAGSLGRDLGDRFPLGGELGRPLDAFLIGPDRAVVLADIMRRVMPDRSATETEQQLWADVDALHSWTPVYDDLLARAHIPAYLDIVRQFHGPALAERLSRDLALPALISKLSTYATAGHEPHELLRRILRVRVLDTADDIAAVLCWRLDQLMRHTTADPTIAERAVEWR
ncbi:hypothetical protein ABZ351_38215, partial [Streptomyces microflavus]